MQDKVYSIKDLEVISGTKAHTIRMWERRYNLLCPSRTDTNIRFYNDQELRRIMNISALVKRKFKISKLAKMKDEALRELVLSSGETRGDDDFILEQMVLHMLHFDDAALSGLIDDTMETYGFEESVNRFVFPLLNKIGVFWQVGSIYPAQEHFVSNLIKQKFIFHFEQQPVTTGVGKTMLFFLHEKEQHDLALLFYSVMARKYGYHVLYLGQSVPLQNLEYMKSVMEIDYVFTAFTNGLDAEELGQMLLTMARILEGSKFLITGYQIRMHKPVLPPGFRIVESYKDLQMLD